jgi:KDO2-lipid IV(A) lauroyltransferase
MRNFIIKFYSQCIIILLYILSLLPLKFIHNVLAKLVIKLIPANTRLKKVIDKNLTLCYPKLSLNEHEQLAKETLLETIKSFLELGIIWLKSPEYCLNLVKKVENENLIIDAYKKGAVILLSPHFGNWELTGLYNSTHFKNNLVLYKRPKIKDLDFFILKARERNGANLVAIENNGIKKLFKALRNQQLIGILPDQVPELNSGEFAPFFGISTYTMSLVPRLAHKFNATVIFTYSKRLENSEGFIVNYFTASAKIYSKDIGEATTALNQDIEKCIAVCPNQYQWAYKRFKIRPKGEKSFY